MAAGCPHDGIGNIRVHAAAMTQHAYRQHLGLVGHTGAADAVAGGFGNRSGHVRAVPGAFAGGGKKPAFAIGCFPIPVIQRTWRTCIGGTSRDVRAGDEVVALQQIAGQVRMPRQDAGIDDRHDHALALGGGPGCRRIDATDRIGEMPLIARQQRVVGQAASAALQRIHARVDLRILHCRIRLQCAHQAVGVAAAQWHGQPDQLAAHRQRTHMRWRAWHAAARGRYQPHCRARCRRSDRGRRRRADAARSHPAAAVLDDDAVDRGIAHGLLTLRSARVGIRCGGAGNAAGERQDRAAGDGERAGTMGLNHDDVLFKMECNANERARSGRRRSRCDGKACVTSRNRHRGRSTCRHR